MMNQHKVVIVGGGFGGLYAAMALRKASVEVTLLDRRNFHLFQPLLYQVATGGLSPANIAAPLRGILKRQKNCRVLMGDVVDFDLSAKKVLLQDGDAVPFDSLVLATGSTHHYFGHDADWAPHAPGLKTIEDATAIRRDVLGAFEAAEREADLEHRKKLLTFVVVGGGPTGVEMAGAIAELAHITMRNDFRSIDPKAARVILVEGQTRLLGTFHPKLSEAAAVSLQRMGVEVWLDCHVNEVTADHVLFESDATKDSHRIETNNVVWAAGVKASPLGRKLAEKVGPTVEVDRGGRLTVTPDCSLPGQPNLFIVGDLASFKGPDGKPLPGLAPVAMQQGRYVAEVIANRIKGRTPLAPFKYWDKGTMATIGRSRAVAETSGIQLTGFIAWLAWLFIHILYLAQFENRVMVVFQWFWNFITRNRAARLITNERPREVAVPVAMPMK
ncbi:NAD(P)/FAD-dependent oxidoreductase [soil metagenome]